MAFLGQNIGVLLGPVFSANGSRRRAVHPQCGVVTAKRVCPECHNNLPSGYDSIAGRIIALVGAKESGKTTYITVLMRELQERVGEDFGAAVGAMDDRTAQDYVYQHRMLFSEGRLPGPTVSWRAVINNPQLFRFTVPRSTVLLNRSLSSSLVFFDTAGEDLQTEDRTATVAYLARADGIILVVDPLQFGAVRESLGSSVDHLPAQGTPPEQIVSNIGQFIRAQRDQPWNRRISTPLAVTLTKIDMLQPQLSPGSRLRTPSSHNGYFDEKDRLQVDKEVRALMQDWDSGALRRQVEAEFANHSFFALSALGAAPSAANRIPPQGIRPFRSEDPILWLLRRFGLIPGRKAR